MVCSVIARAASDPRASAAAIKETRLPGGEPGRLSAEPAQGGRACQARGLRAVRRGATRRATYLRQARARHAKGAPARRTRRLPPGPEEHGGASSRRLRNRTGPAWRAALVPPSPGLLTSPARGLHPKVTALSTHTEINGPTPEFSALQIADSGRLPAAMASSRSKACR
jgi:hypothetical protein